MTQSKYQKWARENFQVGTPVEEFWHPEIQEECRVMNEEVAAANRRAREVAASKIKEVVESVDAMEEEFKGCIVLRHGFSGSLQESKAITRGEAERLLSSMDKDERDKVLKEFKGTKRLFSREGFPQWEALKKARNKWSEQLKNYGIPFISGGMTVVRISLIPDIELLCDRIEAEHEKLVTAMIEAYPKAISSEVVDSPLYDKSDYRRAETFPGFFKPLRKWMHFGVPDVLKEIDLARWEKERQRTAEAWAGIKQEGILVLRENLLEMTSRLKEALEPDADGNKKRFYTTSVTNMTEFFETFSNRNISGDKDLERMVEELKALVSNKDIETLKSNESARAQVRARMAEATAKLQTLVVDASMRAIRME